MKPIIKRNASVYANTSSNSYNESYSNSSDSSYDDSVSEKKSHKKSRHSTRFFPAATPQDHAAEIYLQNSIKQIQQHIRHLKNFYIIEKNKNKKIKYLQLVLHQQNVSQDPSFRHCITTVNQTHPELKKLYDSLSRHDKTWNVIAKAQQYDISETSIESNKLELTNTEMSDLEHNLSSSLR